MIEPTPIDPASRGTAMSASDAPARPPEEASRSLPELFREQETPLLRYAFSLTGNRTTAEDIVQEVFLQLHRHWSEVAQPVSWLFRSVRNRAYNHHRDHRREVLTDNADDGATDEENASLLLRMEAAGFLRLLLSEMDEADRELIRLKYFEDLSYREIGEKTGLKVGTVGYRLHHLLKTLAENLRSIGIEDLS